MTLKISPMQQLSEALSQLLNLDQLKRLVALTGEPVPPRKAERIASLLSHLEGRGLRRTWAGLDTLQRAAVAEVVHSPAWYHDGERFRAKYGRDPDWGTLTQPSLLRLFFYGSGVLPQDLKDRLRAFVPPPASAAAETIEQLPQHHVVVFPEWHRCDNEERLLTVRLTERVAARELLSMLRLVDDGKLKVGDTTRRPSAATLEAISAMLEEGDFYPDAPEGGGRRADQPGPIRAFAWPLLLQAGGLSRVSAGRLQLSQAGRKALSAPAAQTLRGLWQKWLDSTLIDELTRIECIKGQGGKGRGGMTAVGPRRHAIAATLAACPAGRWMSLNALLRYQRASGHAISVSHNHWNLYIGQRQYGSLGYDGWSQVAEHRYTLCLLFEYAATLGILDVAYVDPAWARTDYRGNWGTDDMTFFSRYDGLIYLRVSALGAYVLGSAASYAAPAPSGSALRVLPNLEIVGTGEELSRADRLALGAYAEEVSDFVWRLTSARVLEAVEQGRAVQEIRRFLEERSGAALPDTVKRLLQDAAQRSAQVTDRGLVRLVECADPALAVLLSRDARTRRHCMQAGERHLVVSPAAEAAFRRGLRALGYLLSDGAVGADGEAGG